MADTEDPATAVMRLEQALERIATLAARPPRGPEAEGLGAEQTADVAARLDALIVRLRAALGVTTEQA